MTNLEALQTHLTNHETNQGLATQLEKTANNLRSTLDRNELKELVKKAFWSEFSDRLKDRTWVLDKHDAGDYPFSTHHQTIITSSDEKDKVFLEAVRLALGNWSTSLVLENDCFRVYGKIGTWYPKGCSMNITLSFKSLDKLQDAMRNYGLSIDWTSVNKRYARKFEAARAEKERAEKKYAQEYDGLYDWTAFKRVITACCPDQIKEEK